MNDFNKPIRPINKKDDDKIKVEPIIEKFKEEQNLNELQERKRNKNNFILISLELVKKFFSSLFQENTSLIQASAPDDVKETLLALKYLLEKARDENPKKDLSFASELSRAWNALLASRLALPQDFSFSNQKKMDQLIDAIDHYPHGDEHSLGFYLTRYSEKEWFPLPFFELLNGLHDEYWHLKKSSHLDAWIALISEILSDITAP